VSTNATNGHQRLLLLPAQSDSRLYFQTAYPDGGHNAGLQDVTDIDGVWPRGSQYAFDHHKHVTSGAFKLLDLQTTYVLDAPRVTEACPEDELEIKWFFRYWRDDELPREWREHQ
jgi:hypothetical protein